MRAPLTTLASAALLCVPFVGCGGGSPSQPAGSTRVAIDGTSFLLSDEPDGAVGVISAKESAEDGAPLVLVGRIGGASNPWVDGRAAFTLMDPSLTVVDPGADTAPGEVCMDDCCAAERLACTTLVKFVDGEGRVVPVDSRKLLGVKEGDMVVVKGAAKKDGSGNLSMLATGLYLRN